MALVDGFECIAVEMERAPSNTSATSAAASSAATSSATASTSASTGSSEPFVIDLGELTESISYSEIPRLGKRLADTDGDALLLYGVSEQDFAKIERGARAGRWRVRFSLYLVDAKFLIIKIPTSAHERLHKTLDDLIIIQAGSMGLHFEFGPRGATRYTVRDRSGRITGYGEADSARIPDSLRPLTTDWPTLVIEAGYSQSMPSLRVKAKWWFHVSNHAIKIVILAKWYQESQRIILQQWREVPLAPRPGVAITRASTAATLVPESVQEIEITRAAGITDPNRFNPVLYTVRNGPLQLAFADLFLRQPNLNQGERDIVITNQDLQQYAACIWKVAGL